MKFILHALIYLLLCPVINGQTKTEIDIETAFQNAKKGVYWALSNIPDSKSRLSQELIADDKLIANIKLSKELNGIKIESAGYNLSNEVTIKIYKSFKNLVKEGYLKESKLKEE